MAHNLNDNRMFYTGVVPWHGLGTKLDNPATAKEAIEAAKLDYTLSLQPIYLSSGQLINTNKAVVRKDNKNIMGIVGNRYKIIDNVKCFDFFDSVIGKGQAVYHTAGALGKGERVWILAKLPGQLVIGGNDEIEKYLLLVNSHDGSKALSMFFTPIRVVCQNTLNAAINNKNGAGISIRHTQNYKTKVQAAQKALNIAIEYYEAFSARAETLVNYSVTITQVNQYFDNLLKTKEENELSTRAENVKNELINLFEHGKGAELHKNSAWNLYNAVTEYADHYKTVKHDSLDTRADSLLFGSSARLKQKAFNTALELVTI